MRGYCNMLENGYFAIIIREDIIDYMSFESGSKIALYHSRYLHSIYYG